MIKSVEKKESSGMSTLKEIKCKAEEVNVAVKHPLLGVVVSLALGIIAGEYIYFQLNVLFVLICFLLTCTLLTVKKRIFSGAMLLITVFCVGGFLCMARKELPKDHVYHVAKYYRKQTVEFKGLIISDVSRKKYFQITKTTFVFDVKEIKSPWGWRKKTGKVLVNMFGSTALSYGDIIKITGKLHKPYEFSSRGRFSYRKYLNRRSLRLILSVKKNAPIQILKRGQGYRLKDKLFRARSYLKKRFTDNLTENESGLMCAILLGDRSGIPKHVRELFVKTGTAHILAISGLHVGIVAGCFFMFFRILPINRKSKLIATVVMLLMYMFLADTRPSVVRATVMTITVLVGIAIERESDFISMVSLSALILLVVNPYNIFDIGFQLSYICIISIFWFYPLFERFTKMMFADNKNTIGKIVVKLFCVSLAVWIGVAGVIAYYFQMVTPITIIANIFIVPLLTVVVALGFGMLLMSSMVPASAVFFANCLKLVLNIKVGIIFLFSKMPYAYFYIDEISLWFVAGYYLVLVLLKIGIECMLKK